METIPTSQINRAIAASYDQLADTYERVIVPLYRPLAKRLLQFIDLRPGWHVLDAGAGTGLVALLGAPRVGKDGKMIGVDASERMLEIARNKAAQFGFSQCEFRIEDLEALDFSDSTFNVVLSQFALHYTDLHKSLLEIFRVLQPIGRLVFQIWPADSHAPHKLMYDVLANYRAEDADERLATLRAQGERSFRFRQSYGSAQGMEKAVLDAGFLQVHAHAQDHAARLVDVDAFLAVAEASPLLGAEINALSFESRGRYLNDVRAALRQFETSQGFDWVYRTITVTAQK